MRCTMSSLVANNDGWVLTISTPANATNSTIAVAYTQAQRQLPALQQSGVPSWSWAALASMAAVSTAATLSSWQCPDAASAAVAEAASTAWDMPGIEPAVASDPLKITAMLSTARSQSGETDMRQVYRDGCNGKLRMADRRTRDDIVPSASG